MHSIIRQRIPHTGMDPAMAQCHNNQCSFDENILDYVPEMLIEQPNISVNNLSSFVAATEAWLQSSAVLHMGRSAIARSSWLIHCSNSNSNDITSIASIENMEVFDETTIAKSAMMLG